MTIDGNSVFVDSNVLVYAALKGSPFHAAEVESLEKLASKGSALWISNQVQREFLVQMTRAESRDQHTVAEVVKRMKVFFGPYRIAAESEAVRELLLTLIEKHEVQGKQVHDANIAATCIANGIPRLLTNNERDFKRFVSEITIEPLQS